MSSEGPPSGIDLLKAAVTGDTARVTALLGRGVAVDSRNEDGWTPLMWAARQGHTATVEALLSHKAGIDLQKKVGQTALYCAALKGHTAIVEVLMAAGAGMNIKTTKSGSTPLTVAAEYGHTATVQSLVSAGAHMDTQTNNGQTALYYAAWKGRTAVVEVLVAAGADMNIVNNDGWTALMCALDKKDFEAAEVLIKAGAGLNQQQKDGWTALFYAAKEGHLPSVRLLLEGGADPTHKNKDGNTPFDIAKQNGHDSVMEELKKHTARQPVVIPFSNLDFKGSVGEGSFGVVFKGYWKSFGRARKLVAIKQLSKVVEKEIQILGSLHHPNIIKLYGTSKNKTFIYLVTDFAENGSLFDFISKRQNSPDLKRALPWAKQVAEGMLYLHRRGIVHRDLKSNNVVLTSEWVAKICDLGAARELDHTTMMTSIGTVAWMAPEMLKEERASPKCDVYSYAIVLWELVSFQVPFEGLARFPIMLKVTNGERPAIPSGCDQSLSDLIQRCWAQEFKERPPFAEIVRTLNSFT